MNPLRTTVIMKTDVSGSTFRFHRLLAADLHALLAEHRTFLALHAEEHGGRIIKAAGDGYWLEFPSVTAANGFDVQIAMRLQDASAKLLANGENGIFVTGAFRDALFGTAWHNRLQPVELKLLASNESYRLLPPCI
jgi:class 3 adenylate cyclase